MGTIIALGGGRYDDGEVMPIFERIVRESGKENPHVVFLPTAGHDDTEGDEPIWESFEKLGCTVETLKLTDPANSREHIYNTLVSTDIVYAGGGNLEFMMNTFKATGADEALREAYKRGKVLSGSAPARCAGLTWDMTTAAKTAASCSSTASDFSPTATARTSSANAGRVSEQP